MIVDTLPALKLLFKEVEKQEILYIDTETTGLYPQARLVYEKVYDAKGKETKQPYFHPGARICGVVLGFEDDRTFYVPMRHMSDERQIDPPAFFEGFGDALATGPRKLFVFHNAKFDIKMFEADGLPIREYGDVRDTEIMAHLVDENRFLYGLKQLGKDMLGLADAKDLADWVDEQIKERGYSPDRYGYAEFPIAAPLGLAAYAEQDIKLTRPLYQHLLREIERQNLWDIMNEEHDVLSVVVDMESRGVMVDRDAIRKGIVVLREKIGEIRKKLEAHAEKAGVYIGPRILKSGKPSIVKQADPFQSTKKVPEICKALGMESDKLTKKELESWDKEVLKRQAAQFPFAFDLLEYRFFSKLLGTYYEPYLELTADEHPFIHAEFKQTATKTGRFGCRNPNLQNLLRPDEERDDAFEVKSIFKPRPGMCFVGADYDGMEMAMLGELTGEPSIIDALKEGKDLHKERARLIWPDFDELCVGSKSEPCLHKPHCVRTQTRLRATAKTFNFAVIYGASGNKAAVTAGVKPEEGAEFVKAYWDSMPEVRRYKNALQKRLKPTQNPDWYAQGHYLGPQPVIRNMYGRAYHMRIVPLVAPQKVPEWRAKGGIEYFTCQGSHAILNYDDQGSCADLVKRAMVRVREELRQKDDESWMILQVHDEVVLEVPLGKEHEYARLLKDTLEDNPELRHLSMKAEPWVAYESWAAKKVIQV